MGDADYLYAFSRIIMPIAYEFSPELVFSELLHLHSFFLYLGLQLNILYNTVSAGFDAADGDELGECHVTPAGYAHMTHMLCSLAGGKVVVALEVSHWEYYIFLVYITY